MKRAAAMPFGLLALACVAAATGCNPGSLYPDMAIAQDLAQSTFNAGGDDAGIIAGRTLVWHDEFDGAAGSAPDPTKWSYDIGGTGWGNQELEYYTSRPSNVQLDGDGHLAITARLEAYMGKSYTSARLNTLSTFTHAFGRFEARMQVPAGQGMWPAFWMLGNNYASAGWPMCGEIDVVETKGQDPYTVHGTVHGPGYSGGNGITSTTAINSVLSAGFHVFAVEWISDQIIFQVDDKPYFSITPAQIPAGDQWVYDHPFGVLLNLAVGGNFVGSPDSSTVFPATLLVDYVRVYAPAGQ
ncbi:MAG TPA: glycoside hydrolase family 16 protein [Polyangia bacterium]|nr:glycoside hydrolase family 16 protein [Polyangia bacterium]